MRFIEMTLSLAHKQLAENADYYHSIIELCALTGTPVDKMNAAFKIWLETTPHAWQVAMQYCIDRARRGLSLPFHT